MVTPFDWRSRAGKQYLAQSEALEAHLGGPEHVTVPMRALIDQASRLRLLTQLAWAEIRRGRAFQNGKPNPAIDVYRRAAADEREILRLLGLERREHEAPSVDDYMRGNVLSAQGNKPSSVESPVGRDRGPGERAVARVSIYLPCNFRRTDDPAPSASDPAT